MKSKKSNQANQEDKKHLYIFIGIIISLSFALNLLEWKSFKKKALTIETSFVPKLIEEPILEIKPIQIPKPVKTTSNYQPSDVKIVKKIPVKNTVKVKAKTDPIINVDSLMAVDYFEADSLIIEDIAVDFASDMPKFPGGDESLFEFLSNNINYPEISVRNNSQGKVLVEFIVEKNGSISNIKILKGVDPYINAESIRVISLMPKWIPGKQMSYKVRVRQRLPIKFKLQN